MTRAQVEHERRGCSRGGRTELQLGPHDPCDAGAVAVAGDRHLRGHAAASGQDVGLPAAPDDGEPRVLQESVAGADGIVLPAPVAHRRIRVPLHAQVEGVEPAFVAAVVHVVEEDAIPLRHVVGLDEVEVGRVLDHPARVAGRELDVLDDGVARIARVDLAEGGPDQLVEGAHVSEDLAFERGRRGGDDDACDAGLRARRERERDGDQQEGNATGHGASLGRKGRHPCQTTGGRVFPVFGGLFEIWTRFRKCR